MRSRLHLAAALLLSLLSVQAQPAAKPIKPPAPPQAPKPLKPFATAISGEGGPPIRDTPVGTPDTTTFTINWLAGVDPLAVCNDGSSSAYYYAAGSGSMANVWLVYLEGSMFCWDALSCQQRFATHDYWMSSSAKPWTVDFAQGGIFATDGSSPWGTANRIYVKYCSSDLWSGDVGPSNATFGLSFRGSHIVAAVITDLMNSKGMGKQAGTRLMFGGCSAGAIGAMNSLEAVAKMVPDTVQTVGFLDGAALLNIEPRGWRWSSYLEPLPELMANMSVISESVFAPYCATLFPGEEWKCFIGQYRMPLITSVPFFINAPQFDMFNLMYDTDNFRPVGKSQFSFVEEFQAGTLALLEALPPGTGIFAPTCLVHCLSGQSSFNQLQADNTTLDAALAAWYFNGETVRAVSDCIGWPCVNACGVDLYNSLPCNMGDYNCSALTLATDPGATTSTDQEGVDTSNVDEEMAAVVNPPKPPPPPALVARVVASLSLPTKQPQPQSSSVQQQLLSSELQASAPASAARAASTVRSQPAGVQAVAAATPQRRASVSTTTWLLGAGVCVALGVGALVLSGGGSSAPPQPRAPALPTQRVASKHGWGVGAGGVSGAAELRRLR